MVDVQHDMRHPLNEPRWRLQFATFAVGACVALAGCAESGARTNQPARSPLAEHASRAEPNPSTVAVEIEPKPTSALPETELGVVVEGRCSALAPSFVGDKTFVHARGWIAEIGSRGEVVSRLDTSAPGVREATWARLRATEVQALVGYHPAPLVALIHRGIRGDSFVGTDLMVRTTEGAWKDLNLFGKNGYIREAWPWYDDSILVLGERRWSKQEDAWSGTYEYAVRLGVAKGRPKAPHLSAFKRVGTHCPLDVWAMNATTRGDVVALVGCRDRPTASDHGVWVMRWFRDDAKGRTDKLSDRDLEGGAIALGPRGQAWLAIANQDGQELAVFRLSGERWNAVESPGGNLLSLSLDGEGRPWLATGQALWRGGEAGGEWERVGPPEITHVVSLAGVEHGSPWVIADGAAWARHSSGTWTAVRVSEGAWFPDEPLRLTKVWVPREGEVWVRASYDTAWPKKMGHDHYIEGTTKFNVLLSNVSPPAPLRCGVAVDPAHDAIDLRPWPSGYREGCSRSLLMLMRVTKFGALDGYPGLRKLMRSDPSLASVSIVELEGSGARVVGAWIDADAQVQPLSEGVRAYRSMHSKPELACGDDDTLSAAGFRIVRTLQLEDGGRRFREAP